MGLSLILSTDGTRDKIPTREIGSLLFHTFFEPDVRGARKQVVLKIAVIHQTAAEAEVRTIFSDFPLWWHMLCMLTWADELCHLNTRYDVEVHEQTPVVEEAFRSFKK